ncbi:hypothetical protein J4E80_002775 [Alternaria sp. BMP 0032]|nr:hypothetical protein J4E80_002775 [Alternaria sp. BMP 0032]
MSVFSATNENYAALANIKFDFSLVKMEAPIEFSGIASGLSTRRRVEAEEGPSHKTARRLGALFEDVVPSTPKLISAYGRRMSEIMNASGVNDIGAGQHGPFEPYVGADVTTLWAAATSGIPALGVYLLSCLLARAWDAKVATAIWVEIVAARKIEIEEGLKSNGNVSATSLLAEWFILLWSRLGMSEEDVKEGKSSEFGWLLPFVVAASQLLTTNDQDRKRNETLLKHGTRRAKFFLSDQELTPSPFFGLLNTLVVCGLQEKLDADSGIAYLRAVAEKLKLDGSDAIICYAHDASNRHFSGAIDYYELATVQKAESDSHTTWICPNIVDPKFLEDRVNFIAGRGELCIRYATRPDFDGNTTHFRWADPPLPYQPNYSTIARRHEDECRQSKKAKVEIGFDAILGDSRLGLFLQSEARSVTRRGRDPLRSYQEEARLETMKIDTLSISVENFKEAKMQSARLRDYMCSLIHLNEEESMYSSLRAPGVSLFLGFHKFDLGFSKSLYALESASYVYTDLVHATISLKLITLHLSDAAWFKCLFDRWKIRSNNPDPRFDGMPLLTSLQAPLPDRNESFGCIALLDSGVVDLVPEDFSHAFALCSEDTIYVPAVVLSDPFVSVADHEMRSITGNIGRQGISILVSPVEPRIRELSNNYELVSHEPYDFKREDNFGATSLHLSFTDWTVPLATEDTRMIDHDAHAVEAVISIHDRGVWVGDINILDVDFRDMLRFKPMTSCKGNHSQDCDVDYTSIDSWEELLDEPNGVGVFRAHGNWAARLAAVSILSRGQTGGYNFGVLGPEPLCLRCLEEELEKPAWNMLDYESKLPSFCID